MLSGAGQKSWTISRRSTGIPGRHAQRESSRDGRGSLFRKNRRWKRLRTLESLGVQLETAWRDAAASAGVDVQWQRIDPCSAAISLRVPFTIYPMHFMPTATGSAAFSTECSTPAFYLAPSQFEAGFISRRSHPGRH